MGPPSETCDGACTDVAQYIWNTGAGILDLGATQDPSGNYHASAFNAYGLPTQITYGDVDANPANGNAARQVFLDYTNTSFPGKVTSVRRKTDLIGDDTCTASTGNCAVTSYTYTSDGKLQQVQQTGWTYDATGANTAFTYTTVNSFDTKGRLTQIDGPLAGSNDVTILEYWSSTDPLKDGFLQNFKRKKDTTTFITTSSLAYDFWGNPTGLVNADTDASHATGTVSCQTFDAARGYLSQSREAMAGQTDCTTTNGADLTTSWLRDSALRLTKLTRPDGSCLFYEYDANGRLARTKRRDDCNAASSGDRQEYTYDSDGLLIKIETFDSSSTVTKRQEMTYYDGRQLQKLINPVNTSRWTGISYNASGLVTEVNAPDGGTGFLSRSSWSYNADSRVTAENRYTTGTSFNTWNLLFSWIGDQKQVTDGDTAVTQSTHDDLGRMVKLSFPDSFITTYKVYDAASRLVTVAGTPSVTNTFDNMGRPLDSDYSGGCGGSTNPPEIQRVYDAPPVSCPISGGCNRVGGRLAYVKARMMCSTGLGTDYSLDQETFYSYDDAGRVIREYIRDDSGRVADQQFAWTKNGDLSQVTTPSAAVVGWTYGSAGSNSDTDRISAQWRTSSATPVIETVLWEPYGPLRQYDQENTVSTVGLRTRITHNLAYRTSGIYVENKTSTTTYQSVAITEDDKGRVVTRDYTPNMSGVQDSYFLYDQQDRVVCETTSFAGSCPRGASSSIKNSHYFSPEFSAAGDWRGVLRPIPGSTGQANIFNPNGPFSGVHQISMVRQNAGTPALGDTNYACDNNGVRVGENNYSMTFEGRGENFDFRNNINYVISQMKVAGVWDWYETTSTFDEQNRRVSKSVHSLNGNKTATWYFYYDPMNRLTEVHYIPDISSPTTYTDFQLFWLRERLVLYWQIDYPAVTTSKRYVGTDETGRPIDMMTWPASGDSTRVWAINPSAWGFDTNAVGPAVYQPVLFAGQYSDSETVAYLDDGVTIHRPPLALNGFRTYDPFTGSYLQPDPLVPQTWSTYGYCSSNPVGNQDPSGLEKDEGHGGHWETTSCRPEPGGCDEWINDKDETTAPCVLCFVGPLVYCLMNPTSCLPSWGGGGGGSGTPPHPKNTDKPREDTPEPPKPLPPSDIYKCFDDCVVARRSAERFCEDLYKNDTLSKRDCFRRYDEAFSACQAECMGKFGDPVRGGLMSSL